MKIKVNVFRNEEEMKKSISSAFQSFDMTINVPYLFPAVGEEFKHILLDKVREEVFLNHDDEGTDKDAMPVNVELDTSAWDCRKDTFTVRVKRIGRHTRQDYNSQDDSMSLYDYSQPDEIYYLKGTIEQ